MNATFVRICAAGGALLVASPAAGHVIGVEGAERLVEQRARAVVAAAQSQAPELRGAILTTDVTARCRRAAEHVVRCGWRAAAYYGGREELAAAVVCAGQARVVLAGRSLRAMLTTHTCAH
jgi:hypothetical protein